MGSIVELLRDGASMCRDAELAHDRIDEMELIVRDEGLVIVATRNGHLSLSPRRTSASRHLSWDEITTAPQNPILPLIAEVVAEMNREPTTTF